MVLPHKHLWSPCAQALLQAGNFHTMWDTGWHSVDVPPKLPVGHAAVSFDLSSVVSRLWGLELTHLGLLYSPCHPDPTEACTEDRDLAQQLFSVCTYILY